MRFKTTNFINNLMTIAAFYKKYALLSDNNSYGCDNSFCWWNLWVRLWKTKQNFLLTIDT